MNIFIHELKANRKSTAIWTVSLLALMVLFMSMFPTISKEVDEFKKMLEGFPIAVQQALGIQVDSFASILGYYSYVFMYITLCGAIQAMNLGTSIVSKEVREKTADFLLTKPVTRTTILTAKVLAAVISLLLTSILYMVGSGLMVNVVATDYSMTAFLLINLSLFIIQLIFLALGIFVSVYFPKIKSVLTVSLGTVFAFFIIGMLSATSGDEVKRYLSPFKYFDPSYIIKNTSYELPFLLIGIGFIVVAIVVSYFFYTKKDIHAV
ncbi:ABC transporter permease subunit [Fredinandcohnia sp. 179-A 10B2 NHS]|uniref:ABC transporter permease subunit n=1 Tax=Fredinandcohnia sp. 179-A 10B2 NHS TaxID=3235176 RepID=UPI0039A35165